MSSDLYSDFSHVVDLDSPGEVSRARAFLTERLEQLAAARLEDGSTWRDLAQAFGLAPKTAYNRYRHLPHVQRVGRRPVTR